MVELHDIFWKNLTDTFLTEMIFCDQVIDVFICNHWNLGYDIVFDLITLILHILEHEYLVWDETHLSKRKSLRFGLWESNECPVFGGTMLL